jgi:release factor glutamine methyltransferase
MPDTWTIGRLLTWTADFLKQHGADSPRLDAEVLLAHARGCPRIQLYASFDEEAPENLRTSFRELVKQRAAGKPVAYLVGKKEFYSLEFKVTPDVLIPRPETESLVMAALDAIKQLGGNSVRICDMCTGSGCVAIAIAKQAKSAVVTAVDASPAALAVASENAVRLGVADRVTTVESDLFAQIADQETFHIITANPPYVSEAEFAALASTVREYEPRSALVAGDDGMEVVRKLVSQAAGHLSSGGGLYIEISPMIATQVVELIAANPAYATSEVTKDLAGLARIVSARRK